MNRMAPLGQYGGEIITGTGAHTGKWEAIQVLADTVFTLLTGSLTGSYAALTFPSGTILFGNFTAITLASGSVVAYKSDVQAA